MITTAPSEVLILPPHPPQYSNLPMYALEVLLHTPSESCEKDECRVTNLTFFLFDNTKLGWRSLTYGETLYVDTFYSVRSKIFFFFLRKSDFFRRRIYHYKIWYYGGRAACNLTKKGFNFCLEFREIWGGIRYLGFLMRKKKRQWDEDVHVRSAQKKNTQFLFSDMQNPACKTLGCRSLQLRWFHEKLPQCS